METTTVAALIADVRARSSTPVLTSAQRFDADVAALDILVELESSEPIRIAALADLYPDRLAASQPALREHLALRERAHTVRGVLGAFPMLRKAMQTLLARDPGARRVARVELGLPEDGGYDGIELVGTDAPLREEVRRRLRAWPAREASHLSQLAALAKLRPTGDRHDPIAALEESFVLLLDARYDGARVDGRILDDVKARLVSGPADLSQFRRS